MAILTISREFGSGGSEIGRAIAESLGYEYVDKERILNEIRSMGEKWEEWGKDLDECCPTIWERYDWSFKAFGALVERIIVEYAMRDRAVIMGRGGAFILKGIPFVLRIRVIAPIESRVERIVKRESTSPRAARMLAEKTDHDRACFLYGLYGKHGDDPSDYDFVFNTGSESLDAVTATVKDLLAERDKFRTEEARRLLQVRAAAIAVKTGLILDFGKRIPTLDVECDGKNIIVRGIVRNPEQHRRVEDAARRFAGDFPVKCDLQYRTA